VSLVLWRTCHIKVSVVFAAVAMVIELVVLPDEVRVSNHSQSCMFKDAV